jgi:hypothetical protein
MLYNDVYKKHQQFSSAVVSWRIGGFVRKTSFKAVQ